MNIANAEARIASNVDPGERVLWCGVPRQGVFLRPSDVFLIPFSLLWGGFAVFWEAAALRSGPAFFALWGIPFVLVGLYMIFGRFFLDAAQRAHIAYAVTDRRVIIVSGIFNSQVKSLSLGTISDLSLSERSDGRGTITFGPVNPWSSWYGTTSWPGTPTTPCFDSIPAAKTVFAAIQRAQNTRSGLAG